MKFKVVFNLDGAGVYYDPSEPIHLDALLSWTLAPRQRVHQHLSRDDDPKTVFLPLMRHKAESGWFWKASALLPEGHQGEGLQHWRKRFRQSRADLCSGNPNLQNGTYREWNMPMPLILTRRMVAYADGNRKAVKKLLREVRYLGKKRAHGLGRIVSMDFEEMEEDFSLVMEGQAMRWLPDDNGSRLVRLRPPYWNRTDRVLCCEVGDEIRGFLDSGGKAAFV